jgi:hypothetical protein
MRGDRSCRSGARRMAGSRVDPAELVTEAESNGGKGSTYRVMPGGRARARTAKVLPPMQRAWNDFRRVQNCESTCTGTVAGTGPSQEASAAVCMVATRPDPCDRRQSSQRHRRCVPSLAAQAASSPRRRAVGRVRRRRPSEAPHPWGCFACWDWSWRSAHSLPSQSRSCHATDQALANRRP